MNKLLAWYDLHGRELPWRTSKEPYKIWLSEIIFQQTRIEQGLNYYRRFIQSFPSIHHLAAADQEQVNKLWEGLGYYNRARNLLYTAKYIVNELDGVFPNTYDQIIKLKGVGPYTAAAISSICFHEPQAAVDGNVYRVLSRLYADNTPIDSTPGKKLFQNLAQEQIDTSRPGDFNQAMMDLGALVCTPKNPSCGDCPFQLECLAYKTGRQSEFPVKKGKIKVKEVQLNYYIPISPDKEYTYIKQRPDGGIWPGLYEFPVELEGREPRLLKTIKHRLTHQLLMIEVFTCQWDEGNNIGGFQKVLIRDLVQYAFPRPLQGIVEGFLTLDSH